MPSEWAVRVAALLLSTEIREARLEQWLADLRDAPELGLPRHSIALGTLITSVRQLPSTLHSNRQGQPLPTLTGFRFIAFTLLAAVGGIATYGAVQNLQNTGMQLGYAFTPGGTTFDIEVPLLILSLVPLALGIALLARTFWTTRLSQAAHVSE